ncbi:MAG: DNA modification methylase, partial [Bacteroidales bacterium]|nr:DNA modification methylase [Bacteroidales bacterium]
NDLEIEEKKYIKPVFEPYLVEKYFINENEKEIIYITKQNFRDDCPNLLNHLAKFKEIMDDRRENLQGRLSFYHLHWSRDEYLFQHGAKILSARKCSLPTFTYTEDEAYVMMSFNIIKSKRINLKYLTAFLNSKLVAFWLKHKGKMQGNIYQVDKEPLLEIPIFNTDNEAVKEQIINLVDQLLQLNKDKQNATLPNQLEIIENRIAYAEDKINRLVYELYELTSDEIKLVEKN